MISLLNSFSHSRGKDSSEKNAIWVTEVWDSFATHDASLSLPFGLVWATHPREKSYSFEPTARS